MMATSAADEFAGRMFEAINGMLLDMLAAVARIITMIGAAGRHRGRPRRRRRDGIKAGRTSKGTLQLGACSPQGSLGAKSRA
jgi:hypothetical protein